LDFLVFYSSISALIGNRGQASYVAANSILDNLARALRPRGIPAISINWGALAESGVVARDERLGAVLASVGVEGLTDREALDTLELAIKFSPLQVGAFKVDWRQWRDANPKMADDPRFRGWGDGSGEHANDASARLRIECADASREQRLSMVEGQLADALAETLKMGRDAILPDRKLNEMGVDSLMVLELSLGIRERTGVSFSAMDFLKGPTLRQLALAAESRIWTNGR
jgi:acyl carrier protein